MRGLSVWFVRYRDGERRYGLVIICRSGDLTRHDGRGALTWPVTELDYQMLNCATCATGIVWSQLTMSTRITALTAIVRKGYIWQRDRLDTAQWT